MTLADIESLIEEKDQNIKALAFELQKVKEENEISYLKMMDLNKRVNELTMDLNEKGYAKRSENDNTEVSRLNRIIKEKTQQIDEEREKIKKLRDEFTKRMEDRRLYEDQLFQTSAIPDRIVDNTEKANMFNKLQIERNKNKKQLSEIDKLNKQIEELKKKVEEAEKKLGSAKEENKMFLTTQSKDTKTISRLKKEKEELKEQVDKLKEENENLKRSLNAHISVTTNTIIPVHTSHSQKNLTTIRKEVTKQLQPIFQQDNDKKEFGLASLLNINSLIEKQDIFQTKPVEEPEIDIMKKFVIICLKKNINIARQLLRYDIGKIGSVSRSDFVRSIDELKLGYIDSEITRLLNKANIMDNNININQFVQSMISSEPNYTNVIKQTDYNFDDLRRQSKKYNPFENKTFNINY
jgi:DNA repair exonuclease SbcCD ATPase subunit